MRKIYIVRHGEPDFPGGIWLCIGSGTDLPLSEKGREQARADAPFFEARPITSLWSSPLIRARETAALMTAGRFEAHIHPGLREADIGKWEGLSPQEIRAKFPGQWEARENDMSIPPGGGEDFGDAGARFETALRQILSQTRGDIAVATHQAVTCGFFCRVTGTPIARWPVFAHDYGSIHEVHYDGGVFSLPGYDKEEQKCPL